MSTVLRLEGGGETIDLYPMIKPSVAASGIEALAEIVGFGLAPVSPRWYDGAGAGSTYRGSRILSRPINLPLYAYAASRADLNSRLSDLAVVFDPDNADPARLFFGLPDDTEWYLDVIRESGGDWKRKTDSDDNTYFKTTLSLTAGNPFWTRSEPDSFVVTQSADKGLLPDLAQLQVSSGAAFGLLTVNNSGNAPAWPFWTVNGPATHFVFTGADGEIIEWNGNLADDKKLFIDARYSTVIDEDGVNHYSELSTAPRFWQIKRGMSQVSVSLDGGSAGHTDDTGVETSRNLITHPSMEYSSSTAVARTNLSTDPCATSATGWFANNGSRNTITRNVAITGHPQGITTAMTSTIVSGQTTPILASVYNMDQMGTTGQPARYVGVWVKVTVAGYTAYWGQDGSGAAVNLAANTWTWIPGLSILPAGTNNNFTVVKAVGNGTSSDVVYITGMECESIVLDPTLYTIWGGRAAAGGLTYAWTGAANATTSTLTAPTVTGWTPQFANCMYRFGDKTHSRAYSCRVSLQSGVGAGAYTTFTQVVGNVYTLSAWVYSSAAVTIRAAYTNGTVIAGGTGIAVPANTWTRVWVTGTATATTGYISVVTTVAPVNGAILYIDDAMAAQGSTLIDYYDGSTSGLNGFLSHWDSTADASQSYLTISKLVGKTEIDCQWWPRVWGVV